MHVTGAENGESAEQATVPQAATPTGGELPFSKLGHYRILARIGHGGMGEVYRAYEESLQRTVAIKVLPAELARHKDFVQRFRTEATAAARLVHPNIVQIFYIGEEGGHHFFAMQYVDGESLHTQLARHKKLSIEDAISILEQVLLGLTAAHELGLVHRDIKPANILLDPKSGQALIADFGLVKSVIGGERMTGTGVVMGTVDYLSPEQARGHAIDSRSDLYSVGVLAYQMLSGSLPFVADSATSLIFQHVYELPRPLSEVAPEIPEELSGIVDKLLAKSPQDRQQSATLVLSELQTFRMNRTSLGVADRAEEFSIPTAELVDEPDGVVHSPQFSEVPSLAEAQFHLPSGSETARRRVVLKGVVIALSVIFLTLALLYGPELVERAGYALVRTIPALGTLGEPPPMHSRGYDPVTRRPNENQVPEFVDHNEIPLAVPLRQLVGHEEGVNSVAYDSRGTTIASAASDSSIRLWDSLTGLQIKKLSTPGNAYPKRVAISPDGRFVAASFRTSEIPYQVQIWNALTGEVVQRLATDSIVTAIAFSPRERILAALESVSEKRQVRLWNYDTGKLITVLDSRELKWWSENHYLIFSADGSLLVFPAEYDNPILWRVQEARIDKIIAPELPSDVLEQATSTLPNRAVALSPDGAFIAVGATSGVRTDQRIINHSHVQVFDVATGKPIGIFSSRDETAINAILFSPDGNTLLVAGERVVRVWDVRAATVVKILRSHPVQSMAFDPLRRTLVTGGMPLVGQPSGPGYPYLLLWNSGFSQ